MLIFPNAIFNSSRVKPQPFPRHDFAALRRGGRPNQPGLPAPRAREAGAAPASLSLKTVRYLQPRRRGSGMLAPTPEEARNPETEMIVIASETAASSLCLGGQAPCDPIICHRVKLQLST